MIANKYNIVLIFSVAALFLCSNVYADSKANFPEFIITGSIDGDSLKASKTEKLVYISQGKLFSDAKSAMKVFDNREDEISSRGFYNYNTIGFLTGNSEETDNQSFSFTTVLGYEFMPYLGVGVGLGLEKRTTEIVPFSLSIKSQILKSKLAPVVYLNAGYSVPLSKTKQDEYGGAEYDYEGGFHCGVDVGITNFKSRNYSFSITAGYSYQRLTATSETPRDYVRHKPWHFKTFKTFDFHKIAVRLGFLFRFNKHVEDEN